MKRDFRGLRVAITGASSGIGAATARLLAAKGAAIAISSRRIDRLDQVAQACRNAGASKVVSLRADVAILGDVRHFAETCRRELGDVDVVVANAGYGFLGNTLDMPPEEVEALFRTNLVGAIWTIQAFAHQLEARKGHAIVIGSVVSKIAVPFTSVYSASKWGLRGWTRGARPELESRGISLTLLNPSYTRTEFFERRGTTAPGARDIRPPRGMTSEQVARHVLAAIRRRPAEMDLTWTARMGILFYRLMPIQAPRIMARFARGRAEPRKPRP